MRLANHDGRALVSSRDGGWADLERASGGRFGAGIEALYERWGELREWHATAAPETGGVRIVDELLGSPTPRPRQVLAAGLNYGAHAAESGFERPAALPPIFTKFASSISGPVTTVTLPEGGNTDWEVELAVVIGEGGRDIPADAVWSRIAGLTIAQDLSERAGQLAGPAPQFSLGKSHHGFTPVGPWLVTPDEFANPDDLELGCRLGDEIVQQSRTSQLLFPVPELIAGLSRVIEFIPGDLVLTGTPAGVGLGRTPQRWIQPGEHLVTWIEGIGELRQHFVAAR